MEPVLKLFIVGLLIGAFRNTESIENPLLASITPIWPPHSAQDLVLLLDGAAPQCPRHSQPTDPTVFLRRWRQMFDTLPNFLKYDSIEWILRAIQTLIQHQLYQVERPQGDLKQLLLWGLSHNISWGFMDLPLTRNQSMEYQVLGVSLSTDHSIFLHLCSDHMLPAVKEVCRAVNTSESNILQPLCVRLDGQLCGYLASLVSDLLSGPCTGLSDHVRNVRSLDVNCDYSTWQNGRNVSSSAVSTCSEYDKEAFVHSVCGNETLLMQLSNQAENNWLANFCNYNLNLENRCHYLTWWNTPVSALDVTYCWIFYQETFMEYLCENPSLLQQLRQNPDNLWLDPSCVAIAPTDTSTPLLIQELCSYELWQQEMINFSSVAFCAENNQDGFIAYVCHSPTILQELLNSVSNYWLVGMCASVMVPSVTMDVCNYSMWQKVSDRNQLVTALSVTPSLIFHCSQIDETHFIESVCYNVPLLLMLTQDTNYSWVQEFCSAHLSELQDMCNYTSWRITAPNATSLGLCWVFDQEQLVLYLCQNQTALQQLKLIIPGQLHCAVNNTDTALCNYSPQLLVNPNITLQSSCEEQAANSIRHKVCKNFTLVSQLIGNSSSDWIYSFCDRQGSTNITTYCVAWTSLLLLSACPNCSETEQYKMVISLCSDQALLQTVDLFSDSPRPLIQLIVWKFCVYSSWALVTPPVVLFYYCWNFDQATFYNFLCSNSEFYQKVLQDAAYNLMFPKCQLNESCRYADWHASSVQNSTLQYCIQVDAKHFTQNVCTNSSFMQALAKNQNLSWVIQFCAGDGLENKAPSACIYSKWVYGVQGEKRPIDFSTVIMCSTNDTANFLLSVCNNLWILHGMLKEPALSWTLTFCYNVSSVDVLSQVLVWNACQYSHITKLSFFLMEFCWLYDWENFTHHLCANSSLQLLIKTQPDYFWVQPVCSLSAPAQIVSILNHTLNQCNYKQWHLSQVNISLLKFCAEYDCANFMNSFCSNVSASSSVNSSWCTPLCLWDGMKLCSYKSWYTLSVHPVFVKLCWDFDQTNFTREVCVDPNILNVLLQNPANYWLKLTCKFQNKYNVEDLVSTVCRYSEWGDLMAVPVSFIALCKTYNQESYSHHICGNHTEQFCNNFTMEGWNVGKPCEYSSWDESTSPDNIALCWAFDRENFTAQVCTRLDLLSLFSCDLGTSWVTHICSMVSSPLTASACLSEKDKEQLEWSCSVDLSSVCPGEGLTLLSFLPLAVCSLQNAGLSPDIPNITSQYAKTVDTTVILLLLLEEMQLLSLSGSDLIRKFTLHSILQFLAQNLTPSDQKGELLTTFGDTLMQLVAEQASPESSRILIEEIFQLPLSDLRVIVSSLSPDVAKVLLTSLPQNLTSLQAPDEYFSTLVSSLLINQVKCKPSLLADLIPFLHYMDPDQMLRLLPSLQDNKEVFLALAATSDLFSADQRLALGFWLLRSPMFENISHLSDSVLQQVGRLLPLLPLRLFQQLSGHQIELILPSLPVGLSAPYQRVVASRVLQMPNVTTQDIELIGHCVCQASVQDLERHRHDVDTFSTLKQNLKECVLRGDLFPDTKMLDFLFGELYQEDPHSLSLQSLIDLSPVLSALGETFLQSLLPKQVLAALPYVTSVTLRPAQARGLVQKILINGTVPDALLPSLGSLVLGVSPSTLQQLSTNQLADLLPTLAYFADYLSPSQKQAVLSTLWATGNVTYRLQDLGSLLFSLPLILLRTQSNEILSDLSRAARARWNMQQTQFLFRQAAKMHLLQGGFTALGTLVTGVDCNFMRSFLADDIIQTLTHLRDIKVSLPQRLVQCALDQAMAHTLTPELLQVLGSQITAEVLPHSVSTLTSLSCRSFVKSLKSEPQFVTQLPQQRRVLLLDAVIHCLDLAGVSSSQEKFVTLGFLTPFLRGSTFFSVSRGILTQNVEHVTDYCYPLQSQLLLTKLLEDPITFGHQSLWNSQVLERLDRLVPLLSVNGLQAINKAALSSNWVLQIFSGERKWRKSSLGASCRQSESAEQLAMDTHRVRTLLHQALLSHSSMRAAVVAPECHTLRGSIVSAWGTDALLSMSNVDFMDCLEEIGQDPDIPSRELPSLLSKVLEIGGPVSAMSPPHIARLGRLATKLSEQQLQQLFLGDLQVMEALGRVSEWSSGQLQVLAHVFLHSRGMSVQDLLAVDLVTLGYAVCGLHSAEMELLRANEFCSAVLHLGTLTLQCIEQQLYTLTRLCTCSETFGPVSEWTEDIFREMGAVAAGLQDMELSALVQEQIQGLTPLAVSLIQPKKFAVVFSSLQLSLFSWSQAVTVTSQQKKLLDMDQLKALTIVLTREVDGMQDYRGTVYESQILVAVGGGFIKEGSR